MPRPRSIYAAWRWYSSRRLQLKHLTAGSAHQKTFIVSDVTRRDEFQVWFLAEHAVNAPIVEAM
jgi:hypothetical protein